MKMYLTFIQDKAINRFLNFLSVIKDHKGNAKGLIMNFSQARIQVIYFYLEEKQEEQNYYEYERSTIPYFIFEYLLGLHDRTCDDIGVFMEEEIQKEYYLNNQDLEPAFTFRIYMQDFLEMHNSLSKNVKNFSQFLFKVKTIRENGYKENVFFIQGDNNEIYINKNFKIKTARKKYDIRPLNQIDEKFVSVNTTMRALKEIAEKWKNKLLLKKKEFTNYFLIKLFRDETNHNIPLYIYFYFNNKCSFTLKYVKNDYKVDSSYKFEFNKYYAVRFDHFINVVGDYNIYNYNSVFELYFLDEEIKMVCMTNGLTNEEKDQQNSYYSGYWISIPAVRKWDKNDVEEILSNM